MEPAVAPSGLGARASARQQLKSQARYRRAPVGNIIATLGRLMARPSRATASEEGLQNKSGELEICRFGPMLTAERARELLHLGTSASQWTMTPKNQGGFSFHVNDFRMIDVVC